jgi:opacity protein-like surface antigen
VDAAPAGHAGAETGAADAAAQRAKLEAALRRKPDDVTLKLRLAALLANAGAFDRARELIGEVIAQAPEAETKTQADRLLAGVEQLAARNRWAASFTLSERYQSNPAGVAAALTGTPAAARADASTQAIAQVSHAYAFGAPGKSDSLETTLALGFNRQATQSNLDYWQVEVSVGPRFQLDRLGLPGASVRPYAVASHSDFAHRPFLDTDGAGVSANSAVGRAANLNLSVEWRRKGYFNSDLYPALTDRDSHAISAQAALRIPLTPALTLGVAATAATEDAHTRFWSYNEDGGSAALTYYYRPGFARTDGPWWLSVGIARRHADYELPDPIIQPDTTRHDDEWRAGITQSIPITANLTFTQQLQWRDLQSTVRTYAFRDYGVLVGLTWAASGQVTGQGQGGSRGRGIASAVADWTGPYVGGHGGIAGGRTHWDADAFLWTDAPDLGISRPFDMRIAGGLLGGQVGYNAQWGPWILGAETAASTANVSRTIVSPYFPGLETETTRISQVATVTGRLGYGRGPLQAYVKGGYAGARVATLFADSADAIFGGGAAWRSGWVAGLGVERRVTRVMSLALEYDRFDFGRSTLSTPDSIRITSSSVASVVRADSLMVRVNLRLNSLRSKD